jgi:hypothetical protein
MIANAIKKRIAQSIEVRTLQKFMFQIDKLLICVWIFVILFYPDVTRTVIWKQIDLIFVILFLANFYTFFETITATVYSARKKLPKFSIEEKQDDRNTTDWIDQQSLIEFLLKHNWFPFVIAKSKFWMFPKEYKKLGDNLERVWILERWENNARVLKQKITREMIEKTITKKNSDDLYPPLLQEGNSFKFETI